jgi:pimeloyl-ACP methyl ester carboxylesterase
MLRKLVLLLVCLLVGVSVIAAQETGKTFVLVHGAFQDASGWDAVVPALEAAGHTAVTVALAGRGDDTTPLGELTLANYRDAVVEVIEQQETPVILVGHSFGGIVISSVAEAVPDQIETAVYLAAYLPQNGDSLASLAQNDHFSVLG